MIHMFQFFLSLLFTLCLTNTILCMKSDNNLGPIDKLMLLREIDNKGSEDVRTKIENMVKHHGIRRIPFSVIYSTSSNDDSPLSKNIFDALQKDKTESKNPSNLEWNAKCTKFIPIDECTCVFKVNENNMTIISVFFNGAVLLEFLENTSN